MAALEAQLQETVLDALRRCGCWAHANVVVKKGRRPTGLGTGSPDVLAIIPPDGLHVWFELKRDAASKPSPEQIAWHENAKRYGVRVFVVRQVTEVLAIVQALRANPNARPRLDPVAAARDTILGRLRARPCTVEELMRATGLSKRGTQERLGAMRDEGLVERTMVRTDAARTGIGVWHLPSETAARIEVVVAELKAKPGAFGLRRSRAA